MAHHRWELRVAVLFSLVGGGLVWYLAALEFDEAFKAYWPLQDPGKALIVLLVTPCLEEILFRGLLWSLLRDRLGDKEIGSGPLTISRVNLVTTLLFCAVHWVWVDLLQALLVFAPSLYLGFMRGKGLSIAGCAAVHGLWNYGWFAVLP